jgi:putative membrane protein
VQRTEPEKMRRICGFIVAFAVTKKRHLRDERCLQELESISIQDIRNVQEAEHMPFYCLDVIRYFLHESHIAGNAPINLVALMDVNITELGLAVGRCEKIKNTPMPIAFVVHMRAFMLIWIITLPLVLAKSLGWATMLVCVLVAVAVLGIEGMAVEIENPFGYDCNDLPLDVFSEAVAKDVREVLDRSQHCDHKLAMDGEASTPSLAHSPERGTETQERKASMAMKRPRVVLNLCSAR